MKKFLKWLGMIVGTLLLLVLIALGGLYWRSQTLLNKVYAVPAIALTVPTDAATIDRGEYLATTVSVCIDCHGMNLAGGIVIDAPAIGRIVAPNLTNGTGGAGATRTDQQLAAVLRFGVLPDGRSAKLMPSDDYQYLNDKDLGALIAYVRSVPPQDNTQPASALRPMGQILLALGQLPILTAERIDPDHQPPAQMEPMVSLAYGRYLGDIAGCTGCHGADLAGGPIPAAPPDWPPAADLTPSGPVGQWSEADFIKTIRTGVNPAGKTLAEQMPWFRYRNMTDDDLQALWHFVQSVPARVAQNR